MRPDIPVTLHSGDFSQAGSCLPLTALLSRMALSSAGVSWLPMNETRLAGPPLCQAARMASMNSRIWTTGRRG
jgi:hypothetical protein